MKKIEFFSKETCYFHSFKSANIPQNSAFLSHDLSGNQSNADVFTFSKSATNKVSFSKLKMVGTLREKVPVFHSLRNSN